MSLDLERLMAVWDEPGNAEAFVRLYADPVILNGVATPPAALAAMARGLHAAISEQSREILDVFTAGDRVAVAFVLRGRHTGTLGSRLGPMPASGAVLEASVIDLFTVADGKITEVRAVSDELGLLLGAGLTAAINRRD
ncbi:ester cyclase [Actinoplanes sp. CA-030573]|uniref:ester cyclase n=1 Tax=Actinoplanes sp. CA-030573 TaxID=3239898 RepID=UPI003D8E5D74